MLWDLYQSHQIEQLDRRLDRVQVDAVQDALRVTGELETRVDRLALICRAMFELMEESTPGLSEARLGAKVTEIDLRDGQADGRMRPKGQRCPQCDAVMSPKFGRCLFCGHTDPEAPVRFG